MTEERAIIEGPGDSHLAQADAERTPQWWLVHLMRRLDARTAELGRWERYYDNDHPLTFFDDAFREKFGRRFRRFSDNFTALIIDTIAERLEVSGFTASGGKATTQRLWRIWQQNDLDGRSNMAHTEALIKGAAYALVEPRGHDVPVITIEDGLDCIVELDPRDHRRRLAGLKRWIDEDGRLVVHVYLPDAVHRFRSDSAWRPVDPTDIESVTSGHAWSSLGPLEVDGEASLPNPMGVVPLVPLVNQPRPRRPWGRSEVAPVESNQDLVNYWRALAVVGGRYLAIPQRWVRNLDIERDPVTGMPRPPFRGGMLDLWQVEPLPADDPRSSSEAAQVEFGQFEGSDPTVFLRFIEAEGSAMASIARVPVSTLITQTFTIPPSGESQNAAEASLVRKAGRIALGFGEGWEEMQRVALIAMGQRRVATDRSMVTEWADPSTRNLAVLTDAIIKQHAAKLIDDETALGKLGYSPDEIAHITAALAAKREAEARATAGNGTQTEEDDPDEVLDDAPPIGAGFISAGTVRA